MAVAELIGVDGGRSKKREESEEDEKSAGNGRYKRKNSLEPVVIVVAPPLDSHSLRCSLLLVIVAVELHAQHRAFFALRNQF
ncbi:hypothetical protein FH972_010875 [Carpinus fangiana]|uniref:Uncharacterized protein n=1 Tax=Carpinus fangiana TaxID=176857 RepID=A0A660KPI8_9ROSI|nr:hypothetical protein FH972_010875 [Carpinus fangiana]